MKTTIINKTKIYICKALLLILFVQQVSMTGGFLAFNTKEARAAETISTYNSLVSYVKTKLINRETSFTITYTGPDMNLKSADIFMKSVDDACADSATSAPNEGDYLTFSIANSKVSATTHGDTITFDVTINYRDDAAKEAQVTSKINQLKNDWNIESKTDIEKIKFIHDYVVNRVTYDKTYTKYSAYDALIGQSSVCQGYSLITYRLLKTYGIEARIISGKDTKQNRNHAWIIVKAGGKYYNLDTTWDSTLADENETRYDYFLLSDYDNDGHLRDEEYTTEAFVKKYPVSTESYYFDETMKNIDPQPYRFETMDGGIIANDTSAATILVIGSKTDSNFDKQKEYTENNDIKKNSSIRTAYIDVDTQKNAVFEYLFKTGLSTSNTVALPITILIDKNNRIQFAYIGELVRASKIIYNLNRTEGISIKATPVVIYDGKSSGTAKTTPSGQTTTPSGSSNTSTKKTYVKKGYTIKKKDLIYKVTKSSAKGCEVTVKKVAKNSIKKVTIPAKIKIKGTSYKVVSISKGAFKNCKKLTRVTVGKNIMSIKKGAFTGCKKINYIKSNSPSTKVFNYLKKLLKK